MLFGLAHATAFDVELFSSEIGFRGEGNTLLQWLLILSCSCANTLQWKV